MYSQGNRRNTDEKPKDSTPHGKIKVPLSRRIDKERAQGGQPGGEEGVHEEAKCRISYLPCA